MDTEIPSKPRVRKKGLTITLPALDLAVDLPVWLPQTVIVLAILVVSSVYLWPASLEFPMDDTYIHFVYAENLSETGRLFFNHPDEIGVGSSSLLWVLILAAGNWIGLSMHWVAKVVGVTALAAVGIGLYHLLRPLLPSWVALAFSLLVVLSGHMLWFALSGMETVLFLALGILALLCYREARWVWLGIIFGLMVITRIEGCILALVIGIFDVWRYRTLRRGLLLAGALCAFICVPWLLYLWFRTGHFLPTSGIGRHHSNIISIKLATEHSQTLSLFSRFPALAYPLVWIGYSIEFVLGGYALPAPYFYISPGLGSFSFRVSIWAILLLVTVVIPLIWISGRRLVTYLKKRKWNVDEARVPLLVFLVWVVLHNIAYMIYLPIVGSASRYASMNHIALWLALGLGLWYTRLSQYRYYLATGLTVLALTNTVYWNKVYGANLEHMVEVRIAAADFIHKHIPEDKTCAASDVGALRYYGQRPLVDLGGLIDPEFVQWYLAGKLDQYLVDRGVSCLALPGLFSAGGGGVFDIASELGLRQSSLFDLRRDQVFEVDYQRWLFGYLPTINYQAALEIYSMTE